MNKPLMPLSPSDDGREIPQSDRAYYPDDPPQALSNVFSLQMLRGLLWRRRYVLGGIVIAALLAGFVATLLTTPLFRATATAQVDPQANSAVDLDPYSPGSTIPTNEMNRYLATLAAALESHSMALRVVDRAKLADDPALMDGVTEASMTPAERREVAAMIVQGSVEGIASDQNRIMTIGYTSPDPRLAARIANAYLDELTTEEVRRNNEKNDYAKDYLEREISDTRAQLADAERAALAYARTNGIVGQALLNSEPAGVGGAATSAPQTITAGNLAAINQAYSDARAQRIAAQQRWISVAGTPAAQLPEVQGNGAIQTLVAQRATAMSELADARSRYGAEHPQVKELNAKIGSLGTQVTQLSGDVKSTLRREYEVAQRRESALAGELQRVSGATLDEQDRRVSFNQLDREAQALRNQLDALLNRYNQVASAANVQTGTITKLDVARVPGGPFSPDLTKNLLIALVVGIALAIAIAILVELLDDRLRSGADVERKLGLPLLGQTPMVEEASTGIDDRGLDEAYSSIRTALDFALPRRRHNVVQFTSSQSGEGKTTSAVALARKYARLGRRVLLIDGDLRKPTLSSHFGLSRKEAGLVEVILGTTPLAAALAAHGEANLDVLPMGTIPNNPVDVLSSQQMLDFIEQQRSIYDLVVIDSPPVVGLADAPLLSRLVDGTVFVVEANRAHNGAAKTALRRLLNSDANILGVVLTKFTALEAGLNYDYGYSYYAYGDKDAR